MVDGFAEVWSVVALEGAGDLIGDARPGFVAVDGGRRLAFANAAARNLLSQTTWGGPLAVDDRLRDRLVRFAARAEPGEETRELLRLSEAGRPALRTVVFRRPIESDDAVVTLVDGARADPTTASIQASLAPFVADGGLVALFDADGGVLGTDGDHTLIDGLEEAIERILAEADEIAVLERTVTGDGRRHDLTLVRLGDRPDARRLLRLAPLRIDASVASPTALPDVAAPEHAAFTAPHPEPVPPVAAPSPALEPAAVAPEPNVPEPNVPEAFIPEALAPETNPSEPIAEPAVITTTGDEIFDEDRFIASSPLALDLFSDDDAVDTDLATAWAATSFAAAPVPPPPEAVPPQPPVDLDTAISVSEPEAEIAVPPVDAPPPEALAAAAPIDMPTPIDPAPPLTAQNLDADPLDEATLPEPAALDAAPALPTPTPAAEEASVADAAAFRFTAPDRAVKFVWQMDADHRFTSVSSELAAVVGPAAADLVGRRWAEVAADFDLDRDGVIAGALARRDTWSGRTLLWPVEGEALRIAIDLAALPAFARGRAFAGFRGFGTCRTDPPVPDPAAVGRRLAAAATRLAPATPDHAAPALLAAAPEDTRTAPLSAEDETEVACVVEDLSEPPLFPGDGESANDTTDHPIEPAFAGDIGDDVIFHPEPAAPVDPGLPFEPDAEIVPSPDPVPPATDAATGVEPRPAPILEAPVTPVTQAVETAAAAAIAPVLPQAESRASARVVALSGVARPPADARNLSVPERQAFRQIAEALGARIEGETEASPRALAARALDRPQAAADGPPTALAPVTVPTLDPRLLDRLPLAVALLRDETLVHVNDRFLSLLRYPDLATLRAAGGIDALFAGSHVARRFENETGRPMALIARDGTVVPCEAVISTVPVVGGNALMLVLTERAAAGPVAATAPSADAERIAELQAIVDTATDGVLILDADGLVLSANTAAEALFGTERRAMIGRPLTDRLAPESRRSAMDYLDGLARNGVASVLNDGREVIGAVAPEGLIPLFMTIGRVSSGPVAKYCAVLRDITQWKKSEEDLTSARRRAEEASIHKSDFLAKISHEIRTPLNAIIGFSELMMDERFGPVGNDRYRDYLRDIHVSGSHIMSLVNDLLDLSKVEAGKMDLHFEAVPLADIVSECVAMMQPQANRERIIIRSSLPAGVPPVVADSRSMRQVVLNLLSNAIKFTPAGGQVIISTTAEDNGEVILRVRDTGYGMSDKELQTAMEPFRQLNTTRSRAGGTGLGLPLTKALAEANRAVFHIDSTVGQGTLVSIAFPVTRVLAS